LVLEKFWEVGFYAKLENVNSINLKWNFWVISSLEIAFAWFLVRFRPLLIGLLQLLFEMSNVFLDFNNGPFYSVDYEGSTFFWGVEADNAFQFLKVFLTIFLLLIHANPSKHSISEMNVFDFVISISQMLMPWVHSFECSSMTCNELVSNS
jgi:hypothetical protein